MLGCNSIIRP